MKAHAPARPAASPAVVAPSLAARLRARRAWLVLALVIADIVVIQASLLVLDAARLGWQWRLLSQPTLLRIVALAAVSILAGNHAVGLYDRPWERGRGTMVLLCVWGAVLALLLFTATRSILGLAPIARDVLLAAWATAALCSIGIRSVAALVSSWEPPHRTLIVGGGDAGAAIARRLRGARDRRVVGVLDDADRGTIEGLPVVGAIRDLAAVVADRGVTEVIVATDALPAEQRLELGWEIAAQGVRVIALPTVYDLLVQQARVRQLHDLLGLELPGGPPAGLRASLKRGLDLALITAVLVVLAPVVVVVALLIRLDSRGPVIYAQERVGVRGRRFRMYKFRTMVDGAEERSGPVLSRDGDPRITRVGRVLRRLGLDELPQGINVLRGEMSLVGPRPERPEFVREFLRTIPGYGERLLVRPGVMGLAQVLGRYDTPASEKLKYDLLYIRSASIALDVWIIGETVRMVLAGRPRY